jgi:8-oxo-dGTP pyrophosphatase MutT (NUDIX family)
VLEVRDRPTPEIIRATPTVRVIVEYNNRFLLLQKGPGKAEGLWEFPGGKINGLLFEGNTDKKLRVVKRTGIRECLEETGIDISESPLTVWDSFDYPLPGSENDRRIVYMLHARLSFAPNVVINQTLNVNGKPEDNHKDFKWVTKKQLWGMLEDQQLLQNSTRFVRTLGLR